MITLRCLGWCGIVFFLTLLEMPAAGDIHQGAAEGNVQMVADLLKENPALVNSLDADGDTPLHIAARKGHKELTLLLLRNQADVNAVNALHVTPLKLAKGFGHGEAAAILRQHGGVEQLAAPRPVLAPRPQPRPVESDEERERRREQALGIQTVPEEAEWNSAQFNCVVRLPAGWKRMPDVQGGRVVMITEQQQGKIFSVMVQDVGR